MIFSLVLDERSVWRSRAEVRDALVVLLNRPLDEAAGRQYDADQWGATAEAQAASESDFWDDRTFVP